MKVRELHLTLAIPVVCSIILIVEGTSSPFWYLLNAGVFFLTMFTYGYLKSKGRQGNDKTGFRRVIFTIGKKRN